MSRAVSANPSAASSRTTSSHVVVPTAWSTAFSTVKKRSPWCGLTIGRTCTGGDSPASCPVGVSQAVSARPNAPSFPRRKCRPPGRQLVSSINVRARCHTERTGLRNTAAGVRHSLPMSASWAMRRLRVRYGGRATVMATRGAFVQSVGSPTPPSEAAASVWAKRRRSDDAQLSLWRHLDDTAAVQGGCGMRGCRSGCGGRSVTDSRLRPPMVAFSRPG